MAIALTRLASGSPLYIVADTFGVGVSIVQKIVLEFCHALKKHCQDVFIRWPSPSRFKDISQRFEALHEIPYIVGAIDGSHIPIIALAQHAPDYYCRKGFHLVLLQGIVDSSCCFWDYDVGWCGNIHDYNLFNKSKIGKHCMREKLHLYALLGDVAYQPRLWMLTPYIDSKDGFNRRQEHWNFIQSSSHMYIERAFGILKLQ